MAVNDLLGSYRANWEFGRSFPFLLVRAACLSNIRASRDRHSYGTKLTRTSVSFMRRLAQQSFALVTPASLNV